MFVWWCSRYIGGDIHRTAVDFSPKPEDASIINAWGLGSPGPPGPGSNQAFTKPYSNNIFDDQRHVRQAATESSAR